ncbi:hypothetical protein [Bradyrhizobium cenepequi]|uniref:hypothetical protein n=1 Tax=Bradyrhizobium cenepequi TaxID=2821403 RepID=UPI001CE2C9A9|nr:hypothetical protein [Bradyrhizobium cenepequi]MCA6108065.1 hypothetical protein [Bradyrhizobium cenepequi]
MKLARLVQSSAMMLPPALDWYRANRDIMLCQPDDMFSPLPDQVRWNRPAGDFSLSFDLPFRVDADTADACARRDNVIVMPMSFFALDNDCRIRLAFSAVTPEHLNWFEKVRSLCGAAGRAGLPRLRDDSAGA